MFCIIFQKKLAHVTAVNPSSHINGCMQEHNLILHIFRIFQNQSAPFVSKFQNISTTEINQDRMAMWAEHACILDIYVYKDSPNAPSVRADFCYSALGVIPCKKPHCAVLNCLNKGIIVCRSKAETYFHGCHLQ